MLKKLNLLNTLQARKFAAIGGLYVLAGGLIATVGALNGGTALTSSVWDTLATTIKTTFLQSTFLQVLAFIAMVVAVWEITHGKGYGRLAVVLGLSAVALLGPGIFTSVSTTVGLV